MTNYNPGQSVTLTGVIATSAGVATDPTAAALMVLWPDNQTIKTFLSSTGWSSQGSWNAATNTPTLADGTGTAGHYYTVSAAGAVNFGVQSITFAIGDRVYYDGNYWRRMTGVQTGTLAHPSVGTFSYDYPIPDVTGDYHYIYLSVGIIKAAATPESFYVNDSALFI